MVLICRFCCFCCFCRFCRFCLSLLLLIYLSLLLPSLLSPFCHLPPCKTYSPGIPSFEFNWHMFCMSLLLLYLSLLSLLLPSLLSPFCHLPPCKTYSPGIPSFEFNWHMVCMCLNCAGPHDHDSWHSSSAHSNTHTVLRYSSCTQGGHVLCCALAGNSSCCCSRVCLGGRSSTDTVQYIL